MFLFNFPDGCGRRHLHVTSPETLHLTVFTVEVHVVCVIVVRKDAVYVNVVSVLCLWGVDEHLDRVNSVTTDWPEI